MSHSHHTLVVFLLSSLKEETGIDSLGVIPHLSGFKLDYPIKFDFLKNKLFAEDILQDKRINHLLPFQNEKIYYFDSDSYFSRPTLRILEGAKQLRNSILN